MRTSLATAVVLVLAVPAIAQESDAVKQQFDQLYGSKIAAVKQTPTRNDDVDLAQKLIDDAGVVGINSPLGRVIQQQAVELAGDSAAGVELAVSIMARTLREDPEQYPDNLQKMLDLQEKRHRLASSREREAAQWAVVATMAKLAEVKVSQGELGEAAQIYRRTLPMVRRSKGLTDLIKGMIEELRPWEQMQTRIDKLRERLRANPDDKTAGQELVLLYLLELDNPEQAFKYSFLTADQLMKEQLRDAAKPLDSLDADAAEKLSEWYASLANGQNNVVMRRTALKRAAAALERFIAVHTATDVRRAAALIKLKGMQEEIARLQSK